MAVWNFTATSNSLVATLDTDGGSFEPRERTYFSPSFVMAGEGIKFFESGVYADKLVFTEIGLIDGVQPSDLQNAMATLETLTAELNSGGGGGTVTSVNSVAPDGSGDIALTQDNVPNGTTNKVYTATEKTKLSGIATGATANSSDAILLDRANHTGTQSTDTLTDGTTSKVYSAEEQTKLVGIAEGATANSSDATLKARANHTGAQLSTTISDFDTAAQAANASAIAAKQDTLISATNIKTINGSSLLGSGNLVLAGTGDALVANPLSQFAATTSLQLKGVISDETGSGALVFGTSPTILTSLNVSDGTNTHSMTFGTVGGQANQPLIGGANGYEVHMPTANNTPERFYIAPKGAPSGTTVKLELFGTDYVGDTSQYVGLHFVGNNSTNRWHIGANHSNTGTPTRQAMTIGGYYIGSTIDANSAKLEFETDNTMKITAAGNLQVFSTSAGSCGMSSFGNAIPSAANTVLASYLGGATNGTTARNGGRVAFRSDASWTAGTSHPTYIDFETCASGSTTLTERWRISPSGNFSNTAATGTAYLHLKAGTATASTAPLKLTAGVLNTTPEAGTIETNAANELTYSTGTAASARGFVQVNRYVAKTTTYTATADDYLINCTSGTFTVTLPTAVGSAGRTYIVKNSGAGTITIGTTSSQTIDGASTKSLAVQYGAMHLMSDGANWMVIASI